MSTLASIILILGLISALGVISFSLYYQFGQQNSSSTKLTKDDLTEEWTIQRCDSTFTPLITDINGQLIHVWFSDNGRKIHLESTASDCRISLPKHKRVKRPLQAIGLSIGNVVVALVEEDERNRQENFRIYSFHDRYLCSVSIVKDIDLDYAVSSNTAFFIAQHYTFDVFLKDDRYCGPDRICRRRYEGNTGMAVDLNDTDLIVESDVWAISSVEKNDPERGFIYTQVLPDNKISIQRLDNDLKTLDRREWYGVDLQSTSGGRISLCKKTDDRTALNCSLVDTGLMDLVDKTIDISVDPNARDLQLYNLPDGGAIVLWIGMADRQVLYLQDTIVVRMRIVDALGEVSEVIELLDHNVCEEYEIRSIEVVNGLCFRIGCHNAVSVKCIVPDKDSLFNWV